MVDSFDAVKSIESGLIHADLGGNVVKPRIARQGSGKSGGYRTVVIFQIGDKAVFVEGFAKNVKASHTPREIKALRELAKDILSLTDEQISETLSKGFFREIKRND